MNDAAASLLLFSVNFLSGGILGCRRPLVFRWHKCPCFPFPFSFFRVIGFLARPPRFPLSLSLSFSRRSFLILEARNLGECSPRAISVLAFPYLPPLLLSLSSDGRRAARGAFDAGEFAVSPYRFWRGVGRRGKRPVHPRADGRAGGLRRFSGIGATFW